MTLCSIADHRGLRGKRGTYSGIVQQSRPQGSEGEEGDIQRYCAVGDTATESRSAGALCAGGDHRD